MENQEQPPSVVSPQGKAAFRRKPIFFVAFALLVALGCGAFFLLQPPAAAEATAAPASARPPMPVEVTEVEIASADSEISVVGNLQSNESVVISAEIAGRIERIDFAEGKEIIRGKSLVILNSSVLKAQFDQAEASRALSETNYRRAEALLKDKAIAQRERDEAYAHWQLDEASGRLAKAQLDKTIIVAPFSGTLGLRQVSQGDYVLPGQALVNLEDISKLKVEFRIPEKFSAQVKVGQNVRLQSNAFAGRDFEGVVYAIDPQVEEATRSLVIRALLENEGGVLRPGQFVKVALAVATRAEALFIPEQALITQPKSSFVFTVVDGAAQMVPVETGMRRKGWIEVTAGLAIGDVVVTGGHQKIGPGSPVQSIQADKSLFAKR
jgi:membrane fusion protein (multidrug efflux system)